MAQVDCDHLALGRDCSRLAFLDTDSVTAAGGDTAKIELAKICVEFHFCFPFVISFFTSLLTVYHELADKSIGELTNIQRVLPILPSHLTAHLTEERQAIADGALTSGATRGKM